MKRKFRFAFCIDREGWCFERTADSLRKFSRADATWEKICAIDPQGQMLKDFDPTFDMYRFGGVPLLKWFVEHDIITARHKKRCIPTFASFREATYTEFSIFLHENRDLLAAVVVNDRRMFPYVMQYGVPVIYSPDCVDPTVFKPMTQLRPKTNLPMRVGWAGSEKAWGLIKHQAEIREACEAFGEQVEFVRQDREQDGPKNQAEMAQWFNSLHVYVSANEVNTCTPVPQIEAIACGILPITTRCGERWDLIEGQNPRLVIDNPNKPEIKIVLKWCLDRVHMLHGMGMDLRQRHFKNVISWQCGEATLVTEAMIELAMTVGLR